MFEVGFSEMVVIFALALVVLGPEKLPRLVAQVGRWAGRARAMARQLRDQLETEAELIAPPENKIQPKEPKESKEPNESSHERGA